MVRHGRSTLAKKIRNGIFAGHRFRTAGLCALVQRIALPVCECNFVDKMRTVKQKRMEAFFPRVGAGAGGGARGVVAGGKAVGAAAQRLEVVYKPNVTGISHYRVQAGNTNPTPNTAAAYLNITQLVAAHLCSSARAGGKRGLRNFQFMPAREATHRDVQRQKWARVCRAVVEAHREAGHAPLPPAEALLALRKPVPRLSMALSDVGRISYYCTEVLGRTVRYGDLSYMLQDLTAAELEETDGLPLFDAFVAWGNGLRRELGDDPGGMRAKYLQLVSKTRTGRDGTERVTLDTGEYSAATIFNRSYAWVCAASANVDMMAARVNKAVDACRANSKDASLRAQLDAARLDLEVGWPCVSSLWCCTAVCMPALCRGGASFLVSLCSCAPCRMSVLFVWHSPLGVCVTCGCITGSQRMVDESRRLQEDVEHPQEEGQAREVGVEDQGAGQPGDGLPHACAWAAKVLGLHHVDVAW